MACGGVKNLANFYHLQLVNTIQESLTFNSFTSLSNFNNLILITLNYELKKHKHSLPLKINVYVVLFYFMQLISL